MSEKAQRSSKERRSKKDDVKESKQAHKDRGAKEDRSKKNASDSDKVRSSDKKKSDEKPRSDKSRVKDIKEESRSNRNSSSERSGSESRRKSSKDVKEKTSDQTVSSKSSSRHHTDEKRKPSKERPDDEKKKQESKRREKHDDKNREGHREKRKEEKSREKPKEEKSKEKPKEEKSREERNREEKRREKGSKADAVEKKHSKHDSNKDSAERHKEEISGSNESFSNKTVEQREKEMLNIIEKAEATAEVEAPQNGDENGDGDENYDYDDDDFDDYDDDDFESEADVEMSNNESEHSTDDESDASTDTSTSRKVPLSLSDAHRSQIREAMAIENARVSSNTPPLPSSPANTPIPLEENKIGHKKSKSKRGLDFAGAQKTQAASKTMSKSVKRGHDLLKIIELDYAEFDLLELKPQTEYAIYMKCFGSSDAHQVYTQYNEDSLDKEVMTEGADVKTAWTQHPVEGAHSSGFEGESIEENDVSLSYNPITLNKFISLSTHIIENLLEERASRRGNTQTFKPVEKKSTFSESCATFPAKEIAVGRVPIFLYSISTQTFLVSYTKSREQATTHHPGLTCLWSLNNVDDPIQVLVSNSVHQCSCVSTYNTAIVFAGSEDGSISLWDLNEPQSMHKPISDQTVIHRLPTYNSSGIQMADSHNSKITNLQPLKFEHSQDQNHMTSFQIASLDELGMIIIWVVVEVTDASFSGSQTDLGLRPGGRIKLVKSASINVCYPILDFDVLPEIRTFSFQQHVTETSTFFVTTDQGSVLKASRNKTVPQPMYYGQEMCIPSIISTIDFNHFNCKYFITGSSNGSVSFYHTNRSQPLVSWDRTTRGRPIRCVKWSQFSSTIFYIMDAANKFYFWDLSIRDATPLMIESFDNKGLLGFTELSKTSNAGCPVIVFCFKDGSLEAHQVKADAVNNSVNNITKFESYLNTVL